MAEGITESAPVPQNTESCKDRSYLTALCEDGFQKVKVTNVYKKFVELMCTEENPTLQYLDQAMTPPAPSNTTVKWSVRYLVEKVKDD